MEPVLVLGAGGHAAVVISVLQACGYSEIAVRDDDPALAGSQILGAPVVGAISALAEDFDGRAVIAIGQNEVRAKLDLYFRKCTWITAVHPRAYVHESVLVRHGTVVFAGAVVQPRVAIGRHVIINTSASVDHDCRVEDFAHIGPGVHLSGNVVVGEGAFLGLGAVVIPGKRLGAWSVLGAGGVAIRDVPATATVVGVPARARSDARVQGANAQRTAHRT